MLMDDIEEMLVQDGQPHDNQDVLIPTFISQEKRHITMEFNLSSMQATLDEHKYW